MDPSSFCTIAMLRDILLTSMVFSVFINPAQVQTSFINVVLVWSLSWNIIITQVTWAPLQNLDAGLVWTKCLFPNSSEGQNHGEIK